MNIDHPFDEKNSHWLAILIALTLGIALIIILARKVGNN